MKQILLATALMVAPIATQADTQLESARDIVVAGVTAVFIEPDVAAVDRLFRVEDGKIAEHWDVLQPEVRDTASGNPMWTPAP